MYSKPLLRKYIAEALHVKGLNEKTFSEKIDMTPSNFNRALNQDGFNLTMAQFALVVKMLDLTSNQVFHIITGKKEKEATGDLITRYAKKIVEDLK